MADTWRLFVALQLPQEILDTLAHAQGALKRQVPRGAVRWTNPEGIHLTLKFLGDVPVSQRAALEAALAEAAQSVPPFTLRTAQIGCFPNARRPRVIWVGLAGETRPLGALRDAVETQIAPLGYPTENRPFSPHLTLGRVRRDAAGDDLAALTAALDGAPRVEPQDWRGSAVSLMRSDLRPTGAVYTALAEVPLATRDA